MTKHDQRRLSRREFVSLGVGAFVVAAAPAWVGGRRRLYRRRVPLMGTVAEVGVVDRDAERARAAADAAFAALRRVEAAMTRFDPTSDVGRANVHAARRSVAVGEETAEVVRAALRWAEWSDGAFDPALGDVTALWDVEHRREPPEAEEVAAFAARRLHRLVDVSSRGGVPVLRYGDPRVGIDLGGIAKGYGVDAAAEALRAHGVRDAMVNVGGDLVALGASEDGDPWEVGVRSASDPDRLERVLRISDRAVATSGDYLRYFRHGGRRYHHLIDPTTAAPRRTGVRSVTVVADDCLTADAAATMAFCMPLERSVAVLAEHRSDARILRVGEVPA